MPGGVALPHRPRLEHVRRLDRQPVVAHERDLGRRVGRGVPQVVRAVRRDGEAGGGPGAVALLAHQRLEPGVVHPQSALARHHVGEVGGEAVGVVEQERHLARDRRRGGPLADVLDGLLERLPDVRLLQEVERAAVVRQPGRVVDVEGDRLEQVDPALQRLEERLLLAGQHARRRLPALDQLGERLAHLLRQRRQQRRQKRLPQFERLVPVADGAAQDPPEHVAPARVAGRGPVGDGDGQRADVVGHDAHGDPLALVVGVRFGEVVVGRRPGALGDGGQERAEQVGVVVRGPALEHGADPLEPHPRVDVPVGEGLEGDGALPVRRPRFAVRRHRVVLDEHEVPDLHHARVVLVHELLAGRDGAFVVVAEVDVDLGARAAGAGLAHHPEVVLRRLAEDVGRRDGRFGGPEVGGLGVGREAQRLIALVDRHVEPLRVEAPAVHQQLPGPGDRLLFEVVPEAPVAEHLEERVVVRVEAHLVEVVVLARSRGGTSACRRRGRRAGCRCPGTRP